MKRIFTIFISVICLSICHQANAQTDVYLVPNPQTAKWSYIETDSKGKHIATHYNSVESLEGDGVNGNLKLRVIEVPAESANDTTITFNSYRFKDGELIFDMDTGFEDNIIDSLVQSAIKERDVEVTEEEKKEILEKIRAEFNMSGELRGMPRYPEVGKLPSYEFRFKISFINIKVIGENRRIVGTERLQTEAGEFDCFVMEETVTTKAMLMKDVSKTTSWYAYGIGLVKEITCDKKGKLISTMILNEINW